MRDKIYISIIATLLIASSIAFYKLYKKENTQKNTQPIYDYSKSLDITNLKPEYKNIDIKKLIINQENLYRKRKQKLKLELNDLEKQKQKGIQTLKKYNQLNPNKKIDLKILNTIDDKSFDLQELSKDIKILKIEDIEYKNYDQDIDNIQDLQNIENSIEDIQDRVKNQLENSNINQGIKDDQSLQKIDQNSINEDTTEDISKQDISKNSKQNSSSKSTTYQVHSPKNTNQNSNQPQTPIQTISTPQKPNLTPNQKETTNENTVYESTSSEISNEDIQYLEKMRKKVEQLNQKIIKTQQGIRNMEN
jgi:hypothetical protein